MSEMIYRTDELDISDVLYLYKVACTLKCSAKKLKTTVQFNIDAPIVLINSL